MGLFHCPMGAPFYDDEACIDCGMCTAQNSAERIAASNRIREYLKTHAPPLRAVGKIAVCGKGGVGKSTIVALLAAALKNRGCRVLVLDADESNPGLSRMLGLEKPPVPLMRVLSRFAVDDKEPDAAWLQRESIAVADIPPQYLAEADGLRFMMVGKIMDPFQGCACSLAGVNRDFMDRLTLREKEIVLIDMEAGIESFGRGVERSVDTVLIAVEPSFESISLAERVAFMAGGMGIGRVGAILNKVPSEAVGQKMTQELDIKRVKVCGVIHLDSAVMEAGFEGRSPGGSRASSEVQAIADRLLQPTA